VAGLRNDFTPKQMLGTIPKLKQLGLKWATLDAAVPGRGDGATNDTFPDDSMQKVVKAYHDAGIHITLCGFRWFGDGHGKTS